MHKKRRKPNAVAKALRHGLFRPRVERDRKKEARNKHPQ